jgi:threonyl-tRNA synthetase
MPAADDYVKEIQKMFRAQKMHADIDVGPNTLKKKVLNGQLAQYNFIFVVGAEERDSRTVNIRNRDDQATQAKGDLVPLDEIMQKLIKLRDERGTENKI